MVIWRVYRKSRTELHGLNGDVFEAAPCKACRSERFLELIHSMSSVINREARAHLCNIVISSDLLSHFT